MVVILPLMHSLSYVSWVPRITKEDFPIAHTTISLSFFKLQNLDKARSSTVFILCLTLWILVLCTCHLVFSQRFWEILIQLSEAPLYDFLSLELCLVSYSHAIGPSSNLITSAQWNCHSLLQFFLPVPWSGKSFKTKTTKQNKTPGQSKDSTHVFEVQVII